MPAICQCLAAQTINPPLDRLAVNLGGRYDWARTTAGPGADIQKAEAFTGRASLANEATDILTAHAIYDGSFIPSSGRTIEDNLVAPRTGYQIEAVLNILRIHPLPCWLYTEPSRIIGLSP